MIYAFNPIQKHNTNKYIAPVSNVTLFVTKQIDY